MTDITRDLAWALTQVLDGAKEHDLTDQFGIPEDECAKVMSLLAQARDYLAQPKPQAPSKHELFGLLMQSGGANRVVSIEWLEPFAHAVLERWGRPPSNRCR